MKVDFYVRKSKYPFLIPIKKSNNHKLFKNSNSI